MSTPKPTVGRQVWFRHNWAYPPNVQPLDGVQPMSAVIVFVHGDSFVNLSVLDHLGQRHALNNVPLINPGDPVPTSYYAEWPTYNT